MCSNFKGCSDVECVDTECKDVELESREPPRVGSAREPPRVGSVTTSLRLAGKARKRAARRRAYRKFEMLESPELVDSDDEEDPAIARRRREDDWEERARRKERQLEETDLPGAGPERSFGGRNEPITRDLGFVGPRRV